MGSEAATLAVMSAMRSEPDRQRYGIDLLRATGLSSGRLYPALVQLQRRRYVDSAWHGNGRRGYALTPAGLAATVPLTVSARSAFSLAARLSRARAIRPARVLPWALAVGIAIASASAALSRPAGTRLTDLAVYTGAIDGMRHGASLYAFASPDGAPFTYPPFAALILWPLTLVPDGALQIGWTLATVATVVTLAFPLNRLSPAGHRLGPAAITAIMLVSAPVSSDLKYGQVSVGLAALVILDVVVLPDHRLRGVLTGIAAAIKLTPLIFIPMLWFAGRRRAAIVSLAAFTACAGIAAAVASSDSFRFWTADMWQVSRLGYITSAGNQSVNGALMRSGVAGPVRSLVVLIVAGTVAWAALKRAASAGRRSDWLSAVIITGSASVVVSPVSWTHHQLWLVLAVLLPVRGPAWARRAWVAVVLVVMLLGVTALGPPLWSNARLLLAIVIACAVPVRRPPPAGTPVQPDATRCPAAPVVGPAPRNPP